MVDPRKRHVTIYRSCNEAETVREGGLLAGNPVLPKWEVDTAELFGKLEEQR